MFCFCSIVLAKLSWVTGRGSKKRTDWKLISLSKDRLGNFSVVKKYGEDDPRDLKSYSVCDPKVYHVILFNN